ncbi:MAG: hypothetical protein K2H46_01405 [Muribaculaceae bacterium]|nr:hypothetical protein [Muribaculaceae bacterium]
MKINQPIDGMEKLVGQFGETEFVKFSISGCYFFSKEIVKDRHDNMCESIKQGIVLPARKSNNKKFYGGKKVTRKTKETIFNDGNSGNILIKIDKNGNASVDSLIRQYTGYYLKRNKSHKADFINFKISHIWGNKAMHPSYFTGMWNVVLIPLFVNDILDKPSAEDGSYYVGALVLNTLKAIVSKYYDLPSFNWARLKIDCPTYNPRYVLPGIYSLNVLEPAEGKQPVASKVIQIELSSEKIPDDESYSRVIPNLEDLLDEPDLEQTEVKKNNNSDSYIKEEVLSCLRDIGMKAFVDIFYPALKRNPNAKVKDLKAEYVEYSDFSPNAQNSRLSKSRKIFENRWEKDALRIISASYRVNPETRFKAGVLLEEC